MYCLNENNPKGTELHTLDKIKLDTKKPRILLTILKKGMQLLFVAEKIIGVLLYYYRFIINSQTNNLK